MRDIPSRKPHVAILFFCLCLIFVPGCKKKAIEISPEVASSDEALYRLGEENIKRDEEKGLLYLRQVIDSFPKSFYAQRAKLLIADTYFKKKDEGNLILAAAEYREFIRAYPFSPSASYCQYQIAMTFYQKVLKPGRDQAKTNQALLEFKKVITDYPASEEAKNAQENIKDCEERLAAHNTNIGIQYAKRKAYGASISRLLEIVTTYPNYTGMDKVYYYLGLSYFKTQQLDQAVPYFTKLVTDYPNSKLAKKAVKILKEIDYQKTEKKSSRP